MMKTTWTPMVENIKELSLEPSSREAEHKTGKGFPYSSLIESWLYQSTRSQLDITFLVGILSRFVERPTAVQKVGTKRKFPYLKGTQKIGITITVTTSRSRI